MVAKEVAVSAEHSIHLGTADPLYTYIYIIYIHICIGAIIGRMGKKMEITS